MIKFLKKISLFTVPCLLVLSLVVYMDFFKVFFDYDDYYSNDLFVSLNREYVCLKTLEKNSEIKMPDSFILGSSRSQAFKCKDWNYYLPDSSVPFHFDAANEALIGVAEKLNFLEEKKYSINNVLLVLDIGLLTQTDCKKRRSSLTVSHPEISQNSYIDFYGPFLSASLNPKFVASYFDYRIFRKHRSYMGQYILNTKYPNEINLYNMDIFYGKEKEIIEDSIFYYKKTIESGVFYYRDTSISDTTDLNSETERLLRGIYDVFERNNVNYRIVVSPMYDQVKLNPMYWDVLCSIFDKDKVFDYSGVNELTLPLGNYYEKSHYRPHVARFIMKEVYSN